MPKQGWGLFSYALISVLLLSCAKNDGTKPRHPLNEAYQLMDHEENAKAIQLLEKYLSDSPQDKEARILAASAYMGEAGVDIYRSYDAFKDILFNVPLADRLGKGPSSPMSDPDIKGAPLEKFVDYADLFLGKTKHIVSFLSRFPSVEKKSWPLLDRALEHMEVDSPTTDERLYRTFVRIVYLKAYLDQEVLNDEDFGSAKWVCKTNFLSLEDSLSWALGHLFQVTVDFKEVFPDKKGEILVLHDVLKETLKALQHGSPSGTKTFLMGLEASLKESFRCQSLLH